MTKRNGFSALEALLIVIVVVIIGFTGWYVWHSKQSADKIFTQTGNSVVEKSSPQAKKSPVAVSPADQKHYLVIKEWGIKIPLTNEYQDASYCYQPARTIPDESVPDGPYVYLSSVSLGGQTVVDADGHCDGLDALARYKMGDKMYLGGELTTFNEENAKDAVKLGDYYYMIEGSHSSFSNDPAVEAKADALKNYFVSVFDSLQLAQ